jgi:hypothetical protein
MPKKLFKSGDIVKVLPPFNIAFPNLYVISVVKNDKDSTCTISDDVQEEGLCIDRDFDPKYLEKE